MKKLPNLKEAAAAAAAYDAAVLSDKNMDAVIVCEDSTTRVGFMFDGYEVAKSSCSYWINYIEPGFLVRVPIT